MAFKFIETQNTKGWNVLSEDGFHPINKIHKTIPYTVYHIVTEHFDIKCADNHLFFDESWHTVYAKDLCTGFKIQTRKGLEEVLGVHILDYKENMYDVEVKSEKHSYLTNGIVSHNTTTVTCFLLHYLLFNFDKKVAVLANKGSMAREIMSRLQLALTHLPKWLIPGVKVWNKGSFELENGCSIMAASTSSDSVRGSSFSCVTGDTTLCLCDEFNHEFVTSIEMLSKMNWDIVKNYMVMTQFGYKRFDGIRFKKADKIVEITFSDKSNLKCTLDHKILLNDDNFIEAEQLKIGDIVKSDDNLSIIKIKIEEYNDLVYDLINVEDTQSYYTNNVISHNCVFIDECIGGDSIITIRNKRTGKIEKISIQDFYNKL